MGKLGELLRSVGNAVLPLKKTPAYKDLFRQVQERADYGLDVWYGIKSEDARVQLDGQKHAGTVDLALFIKGKGRDKFVEQELDRSGLLSLRPKETGPAVKR